MEFSNFYLTLAVILSKFIVRTSNHMQLTFTIETKCLKIFLHLHHRANLYLYFFFKKTFIRGGGGMG